MRSNRERAGGDAEARSWGAAFLAGAVMVLLSFLGLVLIPNSLLGYLTTRMTPAGRDLVVVGWWMLAFLVGCLVFLRLQRHRKA